MYFSFWIWILSTCIGLCAAQETCYPAGGVAGIVIATIVVTAVVIGLATAAAWHYWKVNKGAKKKENEENHKPPTQKNADFAFDNPYFKDQDDDLEKGKTRSSINNKNSLRSSKQSELSSKNKKTKNGKNHFMFGGGAGKKHRAMDDSCLAVEPERVVVSLRGHDFTGLGFNICGNMRDGILVKDVLHRGPASESGLIKAGDKILNVTVSFTNIVYEDALTILSYASPYDVQLELERISDKTHTIQSTPSGSKRLGSCSFNNSGQKLFHPLYRSQSIDDLTQIDKDTFPSHGIGPRRSKSVGVAAHKLATHFKNSDSKLEEKDRSPASLILSTTGSLNEKMLANVMADGSLHKNGLQWEKRFEDTLESEDTSNNTEKISKNSKAQISPKSSTSSNGDDASSSDETSNKQCIYSQKSRDYRDSPHSKAKLEAFRTSRIKNDKNDDAKTEAQIHQLENTGVRRAKTLAEASSALWQLDQSIKESDTSNISSKNDSPWNRGIKKEITDNLHKTAANAINNKGNRQEGDDESDVSHDSLELSNNNKKGKLTHHNELCEPNYSIVHKQNANQKPIRKSLYNSEINKIKETEMLHKNEHVKNIERIYASNMVQETKPYRDSPSSFISEKQKYENAMRETNFHDNPAEDKIRSAMPHQKKDTYESAVYANQRDMQEKTLTNMNPQIYCSNESLSNYNKANGRNVFGESQEICNSENFSFNYGSTNSRHNGEVDDHKSRYVQNSKCGYSQKTAPMCYQKQMLTTNLKSDIDSNEKIKTNLNQKFIKKSPNPAGMFTQINPFQQPSKQKNPNFKQWIGRGDLEKDPSILNKDANYSPISMSNRHMTSCDASSHHSRHDMAETQNYSQRTGDPGISRTVLISSFENNAGRSSFNTQNNLQRINYRHLQK